MTPRIDIIQHEAAIYEWAVMYGDHGVDRDLGETSIAGCLMSATAGLPADDDLVEIAYRGMHMGTFAVNRVKTKAGEIASLIVDTYGSLKNQT